MILHIELTNRCVLECPACPRTQWKEILKRPVEKSDLITNDLVKFLDCNGGRKITNFLLCGDYGDPIYFPHLFEFLTTFRDTKNFSITTNGSNKNSSFWHQLVGILDQRDTITFAIDGLEDTNHLYRINSNWQSIMLGVDIVSKSRVNLKWKTIVFRTNYLDLKKISNLAQSKGAKFSAEITHRFGRDDLKPPDQYVESNHLFQSEFVTNHNIEIQPQCHDSKTVGCDGYLYPCDWIRNPRTLYKSQLWKQNKRWLQKLKIKDTNYDEAMMIVNDWAEHVRQSSLQRLDTVDVLCKMKCRKGCQQNKYVSLDE